MKERETYYRLAAECADYAVMLDAAEKWLAVAGSETERRKATKEVESLGRVLKKSPGRTSRMLFAMANGIPAEAVR